MLFFIVPAYNEATNIPLLFQAIGSSMKALNRPYIVVIVNDGSTDGTKELVESYLERLPIVLINHAGNKNVGEVFEIEEPQCLVTGNLSAAQNALPQFSNASVAVCVKHLCRHG